MEEMIIGATCSLIGYLMGVGVTVMLVRRPRRRAFERKTEEERTDTLSAYQDYKRNG